MSDESGQHTSIIDHLISRLEEALEKQKKTEGDRCKTPTVAYCIKCDEITIDELYPSRCLDHPTLSSDGYEHGGIQSALTLLRYLQTDTDQSGDSDA